MRRGSHVVAALSIMVRHSEAHPDLRLPHREGVRSRVRDLHGRTGMERRTRMEGGLTFGLGLLVMLKTTTSTTACESQSGSTVASDSMSSDASSVEAAANAGGDAATRDASVPCPESQSLPTCPAAPGAVDCARPEIGCGLDALPSGLPCSAPAQCSASIYPCHDWQKYIGIERVDDYICSCDGGHWSCDDCYLGAALCAEAPDGAPLVPSFIVDAATDASGE